MSQAGKSLGNKVVLAKIPREDFSRFQQYCDQNGETINSSLKKMILTEIGNPLPSKIAGQSVFEYNKQEDNFSWKVKLDDDTIYEIDDHLGAGSVEQLLEALVKAIEDRNSFIRKSKKDSISLPTRLLRRSA